MAKQLKKPPQIKRALSVVERDRKREIGFSGRANAILDDLVSTYCQATGSAITPSHVVRALLLSLEESLPQIKGEISAIGPMKRPGNESKYEAEREEFTHLVPR